MVYHGWEIFEHDKMSEYSKWMNDLNLYAPSFMPYLGKGIELVAGMLILLGLFTRIVVIPLAFTMLFICFFIGQGRIFMEELGDMPLGMSKNFPPSANTVCSTRLYR